MARARLAAALAVATVLLAGCGSPDTTRSRLQSAVGTTFGGLYVLQQQDVGGPQVTRRWVGPAASCSRRDGGAAGTGDWTCTVTFRSTTGAGRSAVYEVHARPGGCYTAAGPADVVGPLTLPRASGGAVRNPLARFDGCFDTA